MKNTKKLLCLSGLMLMLFGVSNIAQAAVVDPSPASDNSTKIGGECKFSLTNEGKEMLNIDSNLNQMCNNKDNKTGTNQCYFIWIVDATRKTLNINIPGITISSQQYRIFKGSEGAKGLLNYAFEAGGFNVINYSSDVVDGKFNGNGSYVITLNQKVITRNARCNNSYGK